MANRYPISQQLMQKLNAKYGIQDASRRPIGEFDVVIVLGGDGFMLRMLHKFAGSGVKLYGINCGTLGFLLNKSVETPIFDSIAAALTTTLHPLDVTFHLSSGRIEEVMAFNEAYVIRSTCQAAHVKVRVDDVERVDSLVADGVMVSTAVGSTAYNSSAGGPTLPINCGLYAITPICPFRPRRWRGALVSDSSTVEFEAISPTRREMSGFADFIECRGIVKLSAKRSTDKHAILLFDSHSPLEARVIGEQFMGHI